ncbi:rod shape-determining protein RodA [Psychrobium sp. 1_MG-2023]|uniref:rod shape-determining protein RodA n=1 Tax=Psychrobium sp. 1_MG-2023 TaxID=3062624 RepID=UPI000C34204A|nr:rod shape-determining protein RodA [Psychrobium sp. 1_MG-2023]MDP2561252.1 rod shape-determining protein RodA [Psychrobium sp. 1_MG-2023]PKF55246.1 rod shape-determining protein RodA [Alteromonadales bacterium alter-6D02]
MGNNNSNHGYARPKSLANKIHIDVPLLCGLLALMVISMVVIYGASGQSERMIERQTIHIGLSLFIMFIVAQCPPSTMRRWAFPVFAIGVVLLVFTLLFGHVGKGAQRWIDFHFFKFQPSEVMKLILPIVVAHYITRYALPPKLKHVAIGFIIVLIPTLLIAKQPDLGTSILIASSGIFALFLAGMSWRIITALGVAVSAFIPVLWYFLMHDYQRRRVLTFLNPESDPLNSGYHIIQSKIAIGSGGIFGKGWLNGTQSQLEFLPERHTDFIFSVLSEEFGLVGVIGLLSVYLFVISRGLYIAAKAQDAFARILAGAITLTFFVYVFVNIGMVSGLLPVVGVPLPLISYGGTSMISLMIGFGIIMSIHTHRKFNK